MIKACVSKLGNVPNAFLGKPVSLCIRVSFYSYAICFNTESFMTNKLYSISIGIFIPFAKKSILRGICPFPIYIALPFASLVLRSALCNA